MASVVESPRRRQVSIPNMLSLPHATKLSLSEEKIHQRQDLCCNYNTWLATLRRLVIAPPFQNALQRAKAYPKATLVVLILAYWIIPPLYRHTRYYYWLQMYDPLMGWNPVQRGKLKSVGRPDKPFVSMQKLSLYDNHTWHHSVICACGKCGSTSLYKTLYEEVFCHPWEYVGPPFMQKLSSERWEGVGSFYNKKANNSLVNNNITFSFAVIRDPKERFASAWRNKLSCGWNGVDIKDRRRLLPQLMKLAGLGDTMDQVLQNRSIPVSWDGDYCLTFGQAVQILHVIHQRGHQNRLDLHFLPQHLGCFRHVQPSQYSIVTTVKKSGSLCQLREGIWGLDHDQVKDGRFEGESCDFRRMHASKKKGVSHSLTAGEETMLDEITEKDYMLLREFLPSSSDANNPKLRGVES